jgi:hypothetical protein
VSNNTIVQATLAGVSPERFDVLCGLGVTSGQFKLFERFSLEELEEIGSHKLASSELIRVAQISGYGPYNVKVYAKLRAYGVEASEIDGVSGPADMLMAIEAGVPREQINMAMSSGLSMRDLIKARDARISIEEMIEAHGTRRFLGSYLAGREWGYSHRELITIMRLAPKTHRGFEIEDYHKVRLVGITHDQVLEVLQDERVNNHGKGYYTEYVTSSSKSLPHQDAYELVTRNVYPSNYWTARQGMTHTQFIDMLNNCATVDEIKACGGFLADNCRISYEEVMQYRQLTPGLGLYGINSYIKLIDAGFPFDEILAAREAGIGLFHFTRLRSSALALTQSELMELSGYQIDPEKYIKLRGEGIEHGTIISNAQPKRDS